MTTNRRDTQFLGFAALLIPEIDEALGEVIEWAEKHDASEKEIAREVGSRYALVIARRTYDLVEHVAAQLTDNTPDYLRMIERIPDLTQWPEESR